MGSDGLSRLPRFGGLGFLMPITGGGGGSLLGLDSGKRLLIPLYRSASTALPAGVLILIQSEVLPRRQGELARFATMPSMPRSAATW
jgi:hypothetical protein